MLHICVLGPDYTKLTNYIGTSYHGVVVKKQLLQTVTLIMSFILARYSAD